MSDLRSRPNTKKNPDKKLPILVGPTGVGKSEVAYRLARRLKAEIISADAFQVYRGMEIGTAQPPLEHQKKVVHHLVGVRKPSEPWNAVEFAKAAQEILDEGREAGKSFLLVGGAGFYIKTLVEGEPPGTAPSAGTREKVAEKVKVLGIAKAHEWLKERDPLAAKRIHVNDTTRIRRALEKTFTTAQAFSSSPMGCKPLGKNNVIFLGLERSREKLDEILRARSRSMWDNGLLDETKHLSRSGIPETHTLWGAIGYAEGAAFLRGEMKREEALERIFRRTRQYAKRQWTWFKHQHAVEWINLDDFPDILSVVKILEQKIVD